MARISPRDSPRTRDETTEDEDDEFLVEDIEERAEAKQDLRTSIDDLTTEADPNEFDQTFTDDGANLSVEGAFDAAAGSKQVIPRIAYVLNYNLVYNEEAGRWEPQKKSDLQAADGDVTKVGATGTLAGLLVGIDGLDSTVLTNVVDETQTSDSGNLTSNVTVS